MAENFRNMMMQNRRPEPGPNNGTSPLRGLVPAGNRETSRYGIGQVTSFINKDGCIYSQRAIGADIRFSGSTIDMTVFRDPIMHFNSDAFRAWDAAFNQSVEQVVRSLLTFINLNSNLPHDRPGQDIYEDNFSDLYDRIYIRSGYDLDRWFTLNTWAPIVQTLYEQFQRGMIGRSVAHDTVRGERFVCATFADQATQAGEPEAVTIPAQFPIEGDGYVYIAPPKNSLTQITKIYVNLGFWKAVLRKLGYSQTMSPLMYLMIEKNYSANRIVDGLGLISAIASEGFNPVGYLDDSGAFINALQTNIQAAFPNITPGNRLHAARLTRLILDIVCKLFLLKSFELIRTAVNPEDIMFTTKATVFYPHMPDAQLEQQLTILHDKWAVDQLSPQRGSLAHKVELLALPITLRNNCGYYVGVRGEQQHDSSEYESMPAINFNEIRFNVLADVQDHQLMYHVEGMNDEQSTIYVAQSHFPHPDNAFCWVDIVGLHSNLPLQQLSYNKVTGEIQMMHEESTGIFTIVYPNSLHVIPPVTVAMKFEERHWPMLYQSYVPRSPPVLVRNKREAWLYNQSSFFGPRLYLWNSSSLAYSSGSVVIDEAEVVGPQLTPETMLTRDANIHLLPYRGLVVVIGNIVTEWQVNHAPAENTVLGDVENG